MSCRFGSPQRPPLSFPLTTFEPSHIDSYKSRLDMLIKMGFSVVTLQPTYKAVTSEITAPNGDKLRRLDSFDLSIAPTFTKLEEVARAVLEKGLHLRFVPHIDADVILRGTNRIAYWRANFVFDPVAGQPKSYFDLILKPLMDILVKLKDVKSPAYPQCKPCMSLTLGSELEASLIAYPQGWAKALTQLQKSRKAASLESRLDFGHKINHDHEASGKYKAWLDHIHQYGLAAQDNVLQNLKVDAQRTAARKYLAQLDYISFSFYPNALKNSGLALGDWQATPTEDKIKKIAKGFGQAYEKMIKPFSSLGPKFEIGEMGLGTGDPSEPNKYDDPNYPLDSSKGRNVRRHFYAGLLIFLKNNSKKFADAKGCLSFRPSTFWTVGKYDILGSHELTSQHRDDAISTGVKEYNKRTNTPDSSSTDEDKSDKGGGKKDENEFCLISLLLSRPEDLEDLKFLRIWRDRQLKGNSFERGFVNAYYRLSHILVLLQLHQNQILSRLGRLFVKDCVLVIRKINYA